MRNVYIAFWGWVALWLVMPAQGETLARRLIATYEKVDTVSCEIRRDIGNSEGEMRWLSRVHFARPDKLHVENYAPLPRRIIADGVTMFQYNEGQPRGFRQSIDQLPDAMIHNLRKVPGTAMEHLFRIADMPEDELEDGEEPFPVRRGYATTTLYVVLHADAQGRLGRLELYDVKKRDVLTARVDFENFEEVVEGVWIPMAHHGTYIMGDVTSEEVIRLSDYQANKAIDAKLFDADAYFEDVEWVSRFEDLAQ